jgi:hypothetical protein
LESFAGPVVKFDLKKKRRKKKRDENPVRSA